MFSTSFNLNVELSSFNHILFLCPLSRWNSIGEIAHTTHSMCTHIGSWWIHIFFSPLSGHLVEFCILCILSYSRVYAWILKSNLIHFKTFFKTLSIHFKTSSPLRVLTGYIGDTLYLTFTIYSIDPSSLSSNHLDANLHFLITMLFNNRRKRTFAYYQAVSVRYPVQMTSNPTGCHK